jgi:hypothetical protein
MQFTIEALDERRLNAVADFSERYWTRPRTADFYRWRYVDSLAFCKTFVAVTEDQCLGLLSAMRKDYLLSGERAQLLEIFDWHGLPGMKGSGVGIRVMRAMMREGVRLFGVGGTPDVLKTLPAMGWQTIGEAQTFELALDGEKLRAGLRERVGFAIPGERIALDALVSTWFRPRRKAYDGEVLEVANVGDELKPLYEGDTAYDLLQLPHPDILKWLTAGYAGAGAFRVWYFKVSGALRGWALTRVYETVQGREAAIVEIFAPRPDVALYAWMISEVSPVLAASRPRLIRARATCPILQAAFHANRFRNGDPLPVHTWPKTASPSGRLHVTLNHADAPFRPLPTPAAATAFLIS